MSQTILEPLAEPVRRMAAIPVKRAHRFRPHLGPSSGIAFLLVADAATVLIGPRLATRVLAPAPTMAAGPFNELVFGGLTLLALFAAGLYAVGPARAPLVRKDRISVHPRTCRPRARAARPYRSHAARPRGGGRACPAADRTVAPCASHIAARQINCMGRRCLHVHCRADARRARNGCRVLAPPRNRHPARSIRPRCRNSVRPYALHSSRPHDRPPAWLCLLLGARPDIRPAHHRRCGDPGSHDPLWPDRRSRRLRPARRWARSPRQNRCTACPPCRSAGADPPRLRRGGRDRRVRPRDRPEPASRHGARPADPSVRRHGKAEHGRGRRRLADHPARPASGPDRPSPYG